MTMSAPSQFQASRVPWRNLRPCCAPMPLAHLIHGPRSPSLPLRRSLNLTAISRQARGLACSAPWPQSQILAPHISMVGPCRKAKRFSTSPHLFRDHHFDTLKFVQRLKDEGFSEEQSKAMMLVLSDVIEESIQNLTRTMVLREGRSLPYLPNLWPDRLLTLGQTPTEVPTPKRWTSRNSGPNSSPSIPATPP